MPKSLYFLVLFPFMVIAQTPTATENYVRSKTYKVATTTSIASPTPQQATQSITYFDGLGRPIQQIANAQSNTSKDIITHIEYDAFGRQVRDYLPFASAQNTMSFSDGTTLKQAQLAQYQSWYGDNNPFSEKLLEASPLNRVLEQAAPGNDWSLTNSVKHTVRFDYQSNTATGAFVAKLFKASATWDSGKGLYEITMTANGTTNYPANQLYVTTTKDENWKTADDKNNTTEEFKDKEGRVVLKRTFDNGIAHDTYYVYDNFGNLTYVIPPKADNSVTTTVLNNLCYQYKYDHRNRLVEKKLPGKDWEFIVYDKLDRVVATGPAFSPFSDVTTTGWMITKYDAFNRPVYTGWENTTATRIAKQTTQNGLTTLSEIKTTSGTIDGVSVNYSNAVLPTSFKLLTVNYYDDYTTSLTFNPVISFTSSITPNPVFYNNTAGTMPKGLPTISWTRVPELSTTTPIKAEMSYTLYDNKGRAVRSFTNNYLGGFTQTDSQLEPITGRTNYTLTTHKRLAASTVITVREDFTYTAQDRLLTHTHKINSNPTQLLAENAYDELGQLLSKKVGNTSAQPLQKVDYNYNIRGWLLNINNTSSLTEGTNPQDLFAFKINYNNAIDNNENNTIQPLYNGNIAETTWLTNTDNVLRRYGYSYDNLNRLKKAVYQKNGGVTHSYNESMSYDKNGNIMSMERNGDFDDISTPFQMDNLTYFYDQSDTTNRLIKVTDATNSTLGFKDDSDGTNDEENDYAYDANGNMIRDDNKGIDIIKYNHLNLPTEIIFSGSTTKKINYLYTASGVKQQKIVTDGTVITTTDYLGGFQYLNTVLQYFPHAEGYVNNTVVNGNNTYNYVFNYTDHLGNIRLTYTKFKSELKILEENHYYPFGLKHTKYNIDQKYYDSCELEDCIINVPRSPYQYKYNGKEYQDELGLNMYDYGARMYDPAKGRWDVIDPKAEEYFYVSPFAYVLNRPTVAIDPDGRRVYFIGGAGNDADGWDYIKRWGQAFSNVGVNFTRVNATHGKNGDVMFTNNYRNSGYEQVTRPANTNRYIAGLNPPAVEYTNETRPVSNSMINSTVDLYKKQLKDNPLAEGEQFNLAGYSYGSVLQAQAALKLADGGQVIDNLILIGSPISDKSDLWKQLSSNKNIKNVIRYDISGDALSNPQDVWDFIKGGFQNSSDDGPHFDAARPGAQANTLIQTIVQWLKDQGVKN